MNIMNEYIKITKNFITNYFRLVLGNKFNRNISNEFLDEYIQVRYYEQEENNKNELKKEILEKLDIKKKQLIQEEPQNKENIEMIRIFYNFILYFDYVIQTKDIEKIIIKIYEKRKQILNKENEEFIDELTKLEEKHKKEIQDILNIIESKEFYLEQSRISEKPEIQEVNLKYNIRFPILYSDFAIKKAFETGNTREDKQFVEYYLLTGQVIKDILLGKMKKQYIVELVDTNLDKKQKMKRLLEIIKNPYIQDKISLKIEYKDFLKNKSAISEIIRQGFKIAIVLDDTFDLNIEELTRLEIFKFVLINKTNKYYEDIKSKIKNVIEIKRNDE